jgi:hypothetical protein
MLAVVGRPDSSNALSRRCTVDTFTPNRVCRGWHGAGCKSVWCGDGQPIDGTLQDILPSAKRLWWLGLGCLLGCQPPPPSPPPSPPAPSRGTLPTGWIPLRTGSWVTAHGHRVTHDTTTRFAAQQFSGPATSIPIPSRHGGGFVFNAPAGVFRASSFLGPLEPLFAGNVESALMDVGSDGVLIRSRNRSTRVYVDLFDGHPKPLHPLGVVAVASTDVLTAAVTGWGTLMTSLDRGGTWSTHSLSDVAEDLRSKGNWIEVVGRPTRWRLDDDGSVTVLTDEVEVPSLTPPSVVLDVAMRGALLEGGAAMVTRQGRAERIVFGDALVHTPIGPVQGLDRCETVRLSSGEVLMACDDGRVLSLAEGRLRVERQFEVLERVYADAERLVIPRGCGGQPGACWRDARGWHDRPERRPVLRWIPSARSGAEPLTSNGVDGLPLPGDPDQKKLLGLQDEADGTRLIDARWTQRPDGSVRIRGAHRFHNWTLTGLEPDGRHFTALGGFADHALGFDGRTWLSSDAGETWTLVATSPDATASASLECGACGCVHGGWVQLGWDPQPVPKRPEATSPTPRRFPYQRWDGELQCTGELRPTATRAWPALRALGPGEADHFHFTTLTQRHGSSHTFSWTLPFDPTFRVHTGTYDAADEELSQQPPVPVLGPGGERGWLLAGRQSAYYLSDRVTRLRSDGMPEPTAVRFGDDRFLTIAVVAPGLMSLIELTAKGPHRRLDLPLSSYTPTLGLDATGQPVLLMMASWYRRMSERQDPDLAVPLVIHGEQWSFGSPRPLPRWRDAVLGDDARCPTDGLRAIVPAPIIVSFGHRRGASSLLMVVGDSGGDEVACIEAVHADTINQMGDHGIEDGVAIMRWRPRIEGQMRYQRFISQRKSDGWRGVVGTPTCKLVAPE